MNYSNYNVNINNPNQFIGITKEEIEEQSNPNYYYLNGETRDTKDTKDTSKNSKFTNYLITSQKYHTPPYDWSEGIFQKFEPVSGNFKIGNNFEGNEYCVNNQSGRGYSANPCGYWNNSGEQFNPGVTKKNIQMQGAFFPTGEPSSDVVTNPNNRVVFGYARIGEEYRTR